MKELAIFILVFCSTVAMAQSPNISMKYEKTGGSSMSFLGISSWGNYEIIYPKEAAQNHIEGTVYISFNVTKECIMQNIEIYKGLGYGLDEIAIEMINLLQPEFDEIPKEECFASEEIIVPVKFKLK